VADALGEIDKTIGGAEGWARLAEYLIIMGGVNGAGMVAGQLYDMGGGAKDATLGLLAMIPAIINSTSAHLQSVAALHRLAIVLANGGARIEHVPPDPALQLAELLVIVVAVAFSSRNGGQV
jgi:hypothetical protein